jgi:diaminohydroxyphosphoribosylaminopyrimidine deaminase/5-amino-6-(5-phosphoribosylamino)uracil reductase
LIDQWLIYMAPVMLGSDARPTHHAVFNSLGQANRYSISAHDLIGDDLRIIMRQVAEG